MGATMTERLDSFFIALFLPVYMALSGYRTDLSEVTKEEASEKWCALELFVALCVSGKLAGCVAAGLFFAMPFRDAAVLALMLNIRGIVEVAAINNWGDIINNWGDIMKATAEHYSILTLSMVLITAVSTPLIKLLYDPSGQFAGGRRRTLEDARPSADLRVLACVYTEDHAAPLIDLLEASSRDSPVSLIVLHLMELVGRAASVLKPHRRRNSGDPSPSDRIVNAFRYLSDQQPDCSMTVSPYVAQAPYTSMHHDVCSLAHGRKANLILLPFHMSSSIVGNAALNNNAIRSVNRAVLHYAPCSVAILVDHGLAAGSACATAANSLLQRAALYFLGGPDDREALAYAARMPISLTVVRFKLRNWVGMGGRYELRDEEVLHDFWTRHRDNDRVVYVEKTVEDAEGTSSVVRSMSEKFDLLIVGRRGGDAGDLEGLRRAHQRPLRVERVPGARRAGGHARLRRLRLKGLSSSSSPTRTPPPPPPMLNYNA
jgi:hypothetical protein